MDWNRYETLGGSGASDAASAQSKILSIRLDTASLCHLAPSARAQSLAILHLSSRATNGLNRQGIRSIGELVDSLGHGLGKLPGIAKKSLSEIHASYKALSSSIKPSGEIDWIYLRRESRVFGSTRPGTRPDFYT